MHHRIYDVIVDNKVVAILDERPLHMSCPVHEKQGNGECRANPHHEADEEREPNQQVPIVYQEG
jgi:hypothetical protein